MVFDEVGISKILFDHLLEGYGVGWVRPTTPIKQICNVFVPERKLEQFICSKLYIGEQYVNIKDFSTFGELVTHVHFMKYYRGIISRELYQEENAQRRFFCLLGDGYSYEIFWKKPGLLRRMQCLLRNEKIIFIDILM